MNITEPMMYVWLAVFAVPYAILLVRTADRFGIPQFCVSTAITGVLAWFDIEVLGGWLPFDALMWSTAVFTLLGWLGYLGVFGIEGVRMARRGIQEVRR